MTEPPAVSQAHEFDDGIRMVLAPNAGPMTHWGTNSYIVGEGEVAIIDPGPECNSHLQALLDATAGETITHILVTHAHLDHSELARSLSQATGAPVLGFGPANAGQSAIMAALAVGGLSGGGEGVHEDFLPDEYLIDGDHVHGCGWSLKVLHTPGHFAGHLAFALGDRMITGDHVMSWSSSLVSPPDGDIQAFLGTSERLIDYEPSRLYPAHGAPIDDPGDRLSWLINHRKSRETSILEALGPIPKKIGSITAQVYTDIAPEMLPAAERNVFAHLVDLWERNIVTAEPSLSTDAGFLLT